MENMSLVAFQDLQAQISEIETAALSIKVLDDIQKNQALLSAKQLKHFEKLVEERRKKYVGPHNEEVKHLNAAAKTVMAPIERAESHLKDQLIAWENLLEKQRKAELERLLEIERKESEKLQAKEEANPFGTADIHNQVAAERETLEKDLDFCHRENQANKVRGTSKYWDFQIIDQTKVPREFLTVNETLVRGAIKDGAREIPGVRIFEQTRIAIR